MSTVAEELQEAVYTLLNGNIDVDGNNIPVYDAVPEDNTAQRYVTIGDTTFIAFDTKIDGSEDFKVMIKSFVSKRN